MSQPKKKPAKQPARKGAKKSAKASQPAASFSAASQVSAPTPEQVAAAKRKFEQGILNRSEAVPQGTPLPPGATHEIVGQEADGTPILKRKRFSAW